LTFADWLKFSLIEELMYEIDVGFQEKFLTNDAIDMIEALMTESHIVTRLANERASFEYIGINDISLFGTSDCYHCCSIA
jgi:hypothetical protein